MLFYFFTLSFNFPKLTNEFWTLVFYIFNHSPRCDIHYHVFS